VRRLIELARVTEGYCVVLGLTDGALVTELLRQSRLKLIAVDEDAATVRSLQRKLAAADLLGERVSVHVGNPQDAKLPQYLASLVVSEDATVPNGVPASVFPVLRPYDGVACLPIPEADRGQAVKELETYRDEASLEVTPEFLVLRRITGPAGAANWGHESAGPGNTWMSRDRAVKAPLGVLWFGGPAENKDVQPLSLGRHVHQTALGPGAADGECGLEADRSVRFPAKIYRRRQRESLRNRPCRDRS